MGTDYALVHLYWNIPPALLLSLAYRPLLNALDVYKICFLLTIAVLSTIPWDSYLIRHNIWSYPPDAVLGYTLFDIPAEELFFFVIQTYNTSLLYCLLSKPTFHLIYLRGGTKEGSLGAIRWIVGALLAVLVGVGEFMVRYGGEGLYMGLILVWAGPFALMLWMLAYQLIIQVPLKDSLLPIALPTLYLWVVDTLALRRGTWVIENGTKLNWQLWEGLEIEEAVFFLATNTLIVFGLIAFDNAIAILEAFPTLFPNVSRLPSPVTKIRALLEPTLAYDDIRISGLQQALVRLRKKSRSFYIASGVFPGRLRADLVLLYSFCRVADDLVDEATSVSEARFTISKLRMYLNLAYSSKTASKALHGFIANSFPPSAHSALEQLPVSYLPSGPLYSLLDGFDMDLDFDGSEWFPITFDSDLELYAQRVAGTVAALCISLVYHHSGDSKQIESDEVQDIISSGDRMGVALQLINIARDIETDAHIGRVYIPSSRLKTQGLTPQDVLKAYRDGSKDADFDRKIGKLRADLLDWAMSIYDEARMDIEKLPSDSRGGVRVMVESYVEIGRVILRAEDEERAWGRYGKATVSRWRRIWVAWRAMIG